MRQSNAYALPGVFFGMLHTEYTDPQKTRKLLRL